MLMPRVLYVAHKSDYARPELGPGFEHFNFFDTLHKMGLPIIYFDIGGLERELGREGMNRRLVEVARAEKPDVMFTVLFRDELSPRTLREVSDLGGPVTFNWFCDDHWRFEDFSSKYAPSFHWVSTTATSAVPKYEAMGYTNVIKTQWAANTFLYRPPAGVEPGDDTGPRVSFVGRSYGNRPMTLQRVRDAGLDLQHWGPHSPNGKIDQDGMIRLFATSAVSLNLSESATPPTNLMYRVKVAIARAGKSLGVHGALKRVDRVIRGKSGARLFEKAEQTYSDQIKGRNFEVPACGGFLLSGFADDLGRYYRIGEEIVCFSGVDDLVAKAQHYIAHPEERRRVARAGYERTRREHSYVHRFAEIFEKLGRPVGNPAELMAREADGDVLEIASTAAPAP